LRPPSIQQARADLQIAPPAAANRTWIPWNLGVCWGFNRKFSFRSGDLDAGFNPCVQGVFNPAPPVTQSTREPSKPCQVEIMSDPEFTPVQMADGGRLLADSLWQDPASMVLILSLEGTAVDVDPSMAQSLGKSVAELRGASLRACLPPDYRIPFETAFRETIREQKCRTVEVRHDGRWFEDTLRPALDGLGTVAGVSLVRRDITAWKDSAGQASRFNGPLRKAIGRISAAAELGDALALLLDFAVELGGFRGGAVYDIEGETAVIRHDRGMPAEFIESVRREPLTIPYFKHAFEHPEEVVHCVSVMDEGSRKGLRHGVMAAYCIALVNENRPFGFMIVAPFPSVTASEADLEIVRILAKETEGAFGRMILTGRLLQLSQQQQVILDAVPLGISHTKRRTLNWANAAHDALFGLEQGKTEGLHGSALFSNIGEFEPAAEECEEQLSAGGIFSREIELRRPDGSRFWCKMSARAIDSSNPDAGEIWCLEDVTERRRREEALRDSEEQYRRLFEVESDAIMVVDHESDRIVDANPAALQLYGYSRHEILNLTSRDISAEPEKTTKALAEKVARIDLRWHRKKDGTQFAVEISNEYFEAKGRKLHVAAIRDITLRMRLEQELKTSEETYRLLFEEAGDIIFIVSAEGQLLAANKTAMERLGYSFDELASMTIRDLNTPEHGVAAHERMREVQEKKLFLFESAHRIKDGGIIPVEVNARPITWNGRPAMMGICRDITKRKHAEEALRASEARLRYILDSSPIPMVIAADMKTIRYVNPAFTRTFGYAIDEVSDVDTWRTKVYPDPDYRRFVKDQLKDLLEKRRNLDLPHKDLEVHMRCKDGTLKTVLREATVLPKADNQFLMTLIDVTDLKSAESAIRNSEASLRRLGDNIPNGMVFQKVRETDGSLRFEYVSAGVEHIHGVTEEMVKQDAAVLIDQILEEDRALFRARFQESVRTLSRIDVELRVRRPDGKVRWVYICSTPRALVDGTIVWDGLALDITEKKRIEDRLRQSQKLEGIGQLAGGVAHEFNNILASMMMSLGFIQTDSLDEETLHTFDEIRQGCNRAADFVKQLLAFSRRSIMQKQPIDWAASVQVQSRLLDRLLGENIKIAFQKSDNLPWADADKSMLEQVLLNLCFNARDAMPRGGTIRLSMEGVSLDSIQTKASGEYPAGQYVCLSVTDTGNGMDEQTMKHLFEPFFTTKDVGQGSGMGLATVRGIVQQHHGWVEVESTPGKGSTFRVYLPALAARQPSQVRADIVRGSATILTVEDDPILRSLNGRLLSRYGYTVLVAANAEEAITVWNEHRNTIDLLLSDITLPGEMTGIQLAERFLAEKPGLKAVLTSGYCQEKPELDRLSEASIVFIPKPYPAETLTTVIRECLSAAAKGSGSGSGERSR
jgi:PAS domain S-box-containing protein